MSPAKISSQHIFIVCVASEHESNIRLFYCLDYGVLFGTDPPSCKYWATQRLADCCEIMANSSSITAFNWA